ncbi:uncharacterized protein LOC143366228 [Andrena cerasifolii]|uniref:uncharacterized protein LOC143366228 n=1 Tax=Andrena cerasifolii TaxID=2819439 RepID=UPI004037ADBD
MPFWNFIRDIFTGRNSEEPRNRGFSDYQDDYDRYNFRNPIWQNDEDDDIDDFRRSRGNMQFHIFSDPLEITKYFESQIDDILKNFAFGFNNDGHNTFANVPPFPSLQDENLRDKMLKSNNGETKAKVDTDLDGKVTADNFSNVWDEYSKPKSSEVFVPQPRMIGKSIRKEYVRRSDGTIEQKQVFRDSEGNEKVTVSQQIGDKIHTVTTNRDKNGLETKTEEFVNIDESEIKGNTWLPSNNNSSSYNSHLNYFPWEKFFKPDPKL